MKLGAKLAELVQLMKSLCHEVMSLFFTTNAPNPPNWIINPCFVVFHSVWVHLGSFHNCMKLGAKRGELVQLMQKLMPRSHDGIFLNKHTRSTLVDPKQMFQSVSQYFGAFGIVS